MFNMTQRSTNVGGMFVLLLVAILMSMVVPTAASANVYGYVDSTGTVRSVTAGDWMTAIATAPNISLHSGVILLSSPADYMIVGETVRGVE